MGSRIGKERSAHQMKAEKAKTRTQPGEIIGKMLVDGPMVRGEASAEVRNALTAAQRDAEDAIERHTVPRQYERVLREYFDRLAGLAGGRPPAEPPSGGDGKGEGKSE